MFGNVIADKTVADGARHDKPHLAAAGFLVAPHDVDQLSLPACAAGLSARRVTRLACQMRMDAPTVLTVHSCMAVARS